MASFNLHYHWLSGKEFTCNAGDVGSIPGSRRSPAEGNGNPFQYSCLENAMDRGAWRATVHEVTKSWTWLSELTLHFQGREGWISGCLTNVISFSFLWDRFPLVGSYGAEWSVVPLPAFPDAAPRCGHAAETKWKRVLRCLYGAELCLNSRLFPPTGNIHAPSSNSYRYRRPYVRSPPLYLWTWMDLVIHK